ncbi:MAG: hypothetical protein U5L74_03120 [Ideonella sp.]|nr:hypothetical protein [Ideonella sp.]
MIAHRRAAEYLISDLARRRLQALREDVAPWVDERTRLVVPDEWIDLRTEKMLGGMPVLWESVGPARIPGDLVVWFPQHRR